MKIFKSFSGLRRHLNKHLESNLTETHASNDEHLFLTPTTNDFEKKFNNDIEESNNIEEIPKTSQNDFNYKLDFESILCIFHSEITVLNLSQICVQKIFESVSELQLNIFEIFSMFFKLNFSKFKSILQKFKKIFNEFQNIWSKYNSTYKRNKVLNKQIVSPKELSIGTRSEKVFNKNTNTFIEKIVPSTFVYISILETLKNICETEAFKNILLINDTNLSGHFERIRDGSNFQNNPLRERCKNFLQIHLYYDDFETTNPIGSKTGSHKLGGIYFILQNLDPSLNSHLHNIHLLALFYTADIKTLCNLNDILKPIIHDINILETDGIQINDGTIFYGTLVAISHDNLGANALHGMVESFQATHCCRICEIDKNLLKNTSVEYKHLLRTSISYEENCKELTGTNSILGIKRRSILNDLLYFKLQNCPSVDIMHDMLEGCIQFEIKLFLKFIISKKICTLNTINNRIKYYSYGTLWKCNKPSPINIDKPSSMIGQRAAQSLILIKCLPLILSDFFIPELVSKWEVIILLIKIINIAFAPNISKNMVTLLKNLIEEHHAKLITEYDTHLLPKHHFMTHYPGIIEKMGPLIHLWSMRFEAKHQFFKNIANKIRNFKNIAKSLAMKHQQLMAVQWNTDNIFEIAVTYGPSITKLLKNYIYNKELLKVFNNLNAESEILQVTWIEKGFKYKKHLLICTYLNTDNNYPIFEEIIDIILIEQNIFFVTIVFETIRFDENYQCFEIARSSMKNVVDLNLLKYKDTYDLHQTCAAASSLYIIPKYKFIFE